MLTTRPFEPARPDPGWVVGKHALLNVHARVQGERTVLEPSNWRIPYQWQPAHYQDHDDQPFLLLLNSSGGFVEGDVAHFKAHLEPQARALFTTTASSKFYKCLEGGTSHEIVEAVVGPGALFEFLPDEAIPFRWSRVARTTHIEIDPTSRVFATDMVSAGRIHYGSPEIFAFDSLTSEFAISIDGKPLAIDRLMAQDAPAIARIARLWGGARHLMTIFAYAPDLAPGIEDAVNEAVTAVEGVRAGVTRLDKLVVIRILSEETWQAHEAAFAAWTVLRPGIAGKPAREIRKC